MTTRLLAAVGAVSLALLGLAVWAYRTLTRSEAVGW